MKFNILFFALFSGIVLFSACTQKEEDMVFMYHATIMAPDSEPKIFGDTMHVHINFDEHDGQTIHHISVRIYNESTKDAVATTVLSGDEMHIHETSGAYAFHADIPLNADNGFAPHNDYVLEAKIWGEEDGQSEVTETVQFHVHEG